MFIAIKSHKTAAAARSFLNALAKASPCHVRTILTDNGKEFTDRLFGKRAKELSGEHEFDELCQALGIEHRLTRPKTPQTNGLVERFNGRLEQVLRSHHFNSAEDLQSTLLRNVWLYNHHLPQKALGHECPVQALKRWQKSYPDLLSRHVGNRARDLTPRSWPQTAPPPDPGNGLGRPPGTPSPQPTARPPAH